MLKSFDPLQRLAFCNRLITTVAQTPGFLDEVIVSDEAIFTLNSEINTRNVICYSQYDNGYPPDHYVKFSRGEDQVMVWVGLTIAGAVLRLHFVQWNLDTSECLRIFRYNVVQRDFRRLNINQNFMWWQQDGAPAHASNATIQYLREQFPGRLMSERGDWPWPPLSLDLAVCDFFSWGHLKQQI